MNNTHTPGPWFIGRHPHNVVGLIEGSEEIVATIGDMPCIRGHDDLAAERGADMESANARLIVAAPELLEALVELVSDVEEDERGAAKLLFRAKAAIAKATGGQP